MDTLLLGAGGGLGKLVRAELATRGHAVRTVARAAYFDADALATAARGCGAIVNCAGASVGFGPGWRGFGAVDTPIGLAAATAAQRTGARMVYVAVAHSQPFARCAYIDAHERVVAAMREIDGVVVRATGFYSAFADLAAMARKRGILADVGDGSRRTNPIDERDLAAIVADAVAGDAGPRELSAGGPDIMTRREIFEHVIASTGRRVRLVRMPAWLGAASSALLRIVHPRLGQFGQFATLLARHDVIADARGTRRLVDYLAGDVARAA